VVRPVVRALAPVARSRATHVTASDRNSQRFWFKRSFIVSGD
jgi:hypothetical protein